MTKRQSWSGSFNITGPESEKLKAIFGQVIELPLSPLIKKPWNENLRNQMISVIKTELERAYEKGITDLLPEKIDIFPERHELSCEPTGMCLVVIEPAELMQQCVLI